MAIATSNGRTAPPATISVYNLKIISGAGALKATCSVKYGDTTVDQVKIAWVDGKPEPFISPPQLVNEYDGRRTYTTIIKWSKELHAAITAAVLSTYYQATNTQPGDPFADDGEA